MQPAGSSSEAQSVIQKPPFDTPPKLLPVERVMMDYPGTDVASLRRLTTALARDAIFGREALSKQPKWQKQHRVFRKAQVRLH